MSARFTDVPVIGGWTSQCVRCDRTTPHTTVVSIRRWQDAHLCQRDAENRVTHRHAEDVLAALIPDDVSVIVERQRDVLTDTNWHDRRAA